LLAKHYQAFPDTLKQAITGISQPNQPILLSEYGALDSQLGQLFGEAALSLLAKAQLPASAITAIGSHGQTVYHAPDGDYPFSLQIGDPNRIAAVTGITTVADFRRRDIALGGQGAPLVPAFHHALFGDSNCITTLVNIGGIANITYLNGDHVSGFDTGPGNTLMDSWCLQQRGIHYDSNGDWAASGRVLPALLAALKQDDYFLLPPPKSTGKEYFSSAWLAQHLIAYQHHNPADIQATLCQFSAETIADAIKQYAANSQKILICGGGVHNPHLLKALAIQLGQAIESTASVGIDPDYMEAMAFAWLARQTLKRLPGSLCAVTGAQAPAVLGGIYWGNSVLR
jgi:anhydro-N-acetylmuramic acid kinase